MSSRRIHRLAAPIAILAVLSAALTWAHAEPPTPLLRGDPVRGKTVYQACMACHCLDENDVGPRHRGVVGRTAGTVPDYPYSPALKSSGLKWDAATLDSWLAGPGKLVPGAKMFFSLPNAQDRADVIAYLAEQR